MEEASGPPFITLDKFTRDKFVDGLCCYLAVALHDRTGWPIYAEFENDLISHAWVMNNDGLAVDINGIHAGNRAVTYASSSNPGSIKPVDAARVRRRDDYFEDWANKLIQKYPEHFGVADFVPKSENCNPTLK